MRQIKFKAWDGKEMIAPTAVINGKAAILKPCNDNREMTDDEGVHYYCNWDMDVVTDYPLMQFTGLQDKNGVDIYEGDVIDYGQGRFAEIVYWQGRFTMKPINFGNGEPSCMVDFYTYPVIGNIHQNPELLEQL
tara:strand:- start:44 stop:445 length:402 start_codon:yes stop_codon:yes gene_type:complete